MYVPPACTPCVAALTTVPRNRRPRVPALAEAQVEVQVAEAIVHRTQLVGEVGAMARTSSGTRTRTSSGGLAVAGGEASSTSSTSSVAAVLATAVGEATAKLKATTLATRGATHSEAATTPTTTTVATVTATTTTAAKTGIGTSHSANSRLQVVAAVQGATWLQGFAVARSQAWARRAQIELAAACQVLPGCAKA